MLSRSILTVALIVVVMSTLAATPREVSADPFGTASQSVNNAFSSVYSAEQNGGDVSGLVEKLNTAIFLIQRANAENATDPSAAATDLSNATTIANEVSISAASVSNSGSNSRQTSLYESFGTIVATLAIGVLVYVRGDRVYRRLWFRVYRNYLVRKKDG